MKTKLLKDIRMLLVIMLCMVCFSCSKKDSEAIPEGSIRIYLKDVNSNALYWDYYLPEKTRREDIINEVLREISTVREENLYVPVLPQNVTIDSYVFGADGQVVIDFSDDYYKMDRIDEILCRAGIVKTLCGLDFVSGVEFNINGQALMLSADNPAGIMTEETFIDNTGADIMFRQSLNITVYFPDESGNALVQSNLIVNTNGTKQPEQLVVERLIAGPIVVDIPMLLVLNPKTQLNSVYTEDGVTYLDFNEAFLEKPEGVSDEVVIYSIVNSLTELNYVSKVSITVDKHQLKSYGGMLIPVLLEYRPELLPEEKAGDSSQAQR